MYMAKGNQIFVVQEMDDGSDKEELFITIHPTDTGGTMTPDQQAVNIAEISNNI